MARSPFAKGQPWGSRAVLDTATLPCTNGGASGAASTFRVGPGDVDGGEISLFHPGPGNWAYAFLFILFRISYPGHTVVGFITDNATDFVEQGLLVIGPHQELVAVTDGTQFAIEAVQGLFSQFAFRDVLYGSYGADGDLAIVEGLTLLMDIFDPSIRKKETMVDAVGGLVFREFVYKELTASRSSGWIASSKAS